MIWTYDADEREMIKKMLRAKIEEKLPRGRSRTSCIDQIRKDRGIKKGEMERNKKEEQRWFEISLYVKFVTYFIKKCSATKQLYTACSVFDIGLLHCFNCSIH
jgi:hypothetical protein